MLFPTASRWTVLLLICMLGLAAAEDVAPARPLLHPLFSDGAVLQRGKPVAIWGWAAPGATVSVTFPAGSPPVAVQAGADGRWQAALGPFTAGGPFELNVASGTATAAAKDVLVGDVWICSGQSNMEMSVGSSANAAEEIAKADWPLIRHVRVEKVISGKPRELLAVKWKPATPAHVREFSAAGFFMARHLHQELRVPIGVINSSYGGTLAQAWTSAEALATLPAFAKPLADFQSLTQQVEQQRAATGKEFPELFNAWLAANDPGTAATPPWSAATVDAAGWTAAKLPGALEEAKITRAWRGTLWLRKEFTLPDAAAVDALLSLGTPSGFETTWVNGQHLATHSGGWDRRYTVPARMLKAGINVIAIRLTATNGRPGLTVGPEQLSITPVGGERIPLAGDWQVRIGVALDQAAPLPLRLDGHPGVTSLFNGMIAPLIPLSCAGFAWYQGEANVGAAAGYRELLPTMIGDWRRRFSQGDLPFLIVSLASFTERAEQPSDSSWAELREAQAWIAKQVPAGGLALAIDIGEAKDVHPKNKQEVGRRLALAALAVAYGKQLAWSGPWYSGMAVEGPAIRLRFDHVGEGLATVDGAALTGFAIAGEDRKFVWAEARIEGAQVVVSAPSVAAPVAVRYAWANNPACNLVNKAGLPAVPFRTDSWSKPAK